MKKRTLLILRHAKSDWDGAAARDFDRPLSTRGRRDAPRMGRWMKDRGLMPDHVLCSPATRARQTAEAVAEALGLDTAMIVFDERVYLAGRDTLLAAVAECPPAAATLLLVGHNPGLDQLLEHLAAAPPARTAAGKLLTAGALAHLETAQSWRRLQPQGSTLVELIRPRELEE